MSAPMTHPHEHPAPSILARRPIPTSIAVGVGTLLPHAFLSPQASLGFAAVIIALIGGVYFGFAVSRGSGRDQLVEFNVSALFAVSGLLGLLYWPILLPLAYLAHAGWDFAHHNRHRLPLVSIPQWYVPWCVIVDVIIAMGLAGIWRYNGII